MNIHKLPLAGLTVLMVFAASSVTSAQTSGADGPWTHGSTLNVFTGVAPASPETRLVFGAALGWEVTRRVAVEGSGSWLARRHGAEAFAADLKALVSLSGPGAFVPFVEGGMGLYRASFRSREGLPEFYERRLAEVPASGGATFTDPSLVIGGGMNVFATDHLAMRPEIDAKLVMRDSHTYVVSVFAVRFVYHFDEHPLETRQQSVRRHAK